MIQLDWDSAFFGEKIGLIDLRNLPEYSFESEIKQARFLGFSLLYIFASPEKALAQNGHKSPGLYFIDTKLIYIKTNLEQNADCSSILADGTEKIDQLYSLALESGKYSRFKRDPRLGEKNFQRLYRAWVDNSLDRTVADDILVYKEKNSVCGFCAVKYSCDEATIVLIAVSPQSQGKGIGRDLCRKVDVLATRRGCARVAVATQRINQGACKFYEKIGMRISHSVDIYHYWLKEK